MGFYKDINQQSLTETGLDLNELREAIRQEYREVSRKPDKGFHFHTGRPLAQMLVYEEGWLQNIPEETVASFAGTGNPFRIAEVNKGERVVDIGCGAGMDALIAAEKVGPEGRVIAVDMTEAMLEKAAQAKAIMNLKQVDFQFGYAEELPVEDNWADVVISNGVINLTPDKQRVFKEIYRVLKPSGRIQIADIMVQKPVGAVAKQQAELWTGCVAGALLQNELRDAVESAGLVDFHITWQGDVYSGAPQQSSAASFGTLGISFSARKPIGAKVGRERRQTIAQ